MSDNPLLQGGGGPAAPPPGPPQANLLRGPPAPAGNPLMPPQAAAAPVSAEVTSGDHISPRVPAPKADFPADQHQDLHDNYMGTTFDHPLAQRFVREFYPKLRHHGGMPAKEALRHARDAFHAVNHRFMTPAQAGVGLALAAMRHRRDSGGR